MSNEEDADLVTPMFPWYVHRLRLSVSTEQPEVRRVSEVFVSRCAVVLFMLLQVLLHEVHGYRNNYGTRFYRHARPISGTRRMRADRFRILSTWPNDNRIMVGDSWKWTLRAPG